MELVIESDYGSESAAAQTSDAFEVVLPVGGRLAGLNVQTLLGQRKNLFPALHVAGGSETDLDVVLTRRVEPKLGIEGRDPEDLILGYLQPTGDAANGVRAQVPILFLHSLQNGDEILSFPLEFLPKCRNAAARSQVVYLAGLPVKRSPGPQNQH